MLACACVALIHNSVSCVHQLSLALANYAACGPACARQVSIAAAWQHGAEDESNETRFMELRADMDGFLGALRAHSPDLFRMPEDRCVVVGHAAQELELT